MYTTSFIERHHQISMEELLNKVFDFSNHIPPTELEKRYTTLKDSSYPRVKTNFKGNVPVNMVSSDLVGCAFHVMNSFIPEGFTPTYSEFRLRKASGGYRTLHAPDDETAQVLIAMKNCLDKLNIPAHDNAYAYIKERDCKKAIERHQQAGARYFLKLDLKKFFDNCTPALVKRQLHKIYPFAEATPTQRDRFFFMLDKVAYLDGCLPQGSHISPILTNWMMIPFDYELTRKLYGLPGLFTYTRYADDLLISSPNPFKWQEVVDMINDLLVSLGYDGLEINSSKTRYSSRLGSNWNLGIMYNIEGNLTVGHKRKSRIKTMMYRAYKNEMDPDDLNELNGELAYLKHIEPEYHSKLMAWFTGKYGVDIHSVLK